VTCDLELAGDRGRTGDAAGRHRDREGRQRARLRPGWSAHGSPGAGRCQERALGTSALIGAVLPAGTPAALVTVVVGGSGALVLYVLSARALKIDELRALTGMLRTRLSG
jgi:hypothetical protein